MFIVFIEVNFTNRAGFRGFEKRGVLLSCCFYYYYYYNIIIFFSFLGFCSLVHAILQVYVRRCKVLMLDIFALARRPFCSQFFQTFSSAKKVAFFNEQDEQAFFLIKTITYEADFVHT